MKTDDDQLRESTIKSIQEAVANLFGLSAEELGQGSSLRVVVVPRQIAMYLTKQMTDASLSEIGRHFGGRHHTTVMQSIAKVHDLRRRDAATDDLVCKLMKGLVQS
jgi:chromosomal replication initiator protein